MGTSRVSRKKLPTANLDQVSEDIRHTFQSKDAAREKTLRLCRETIRHSANGIRALHRQEMKQAEQLLRSARDLLEEVRRTLDGHEDLFCSGLVHDAMKEYAEGTITLAMVTGKKVPDPAALNVQLPAYLNGLGEAVGELRRYLLDHLRRGDVAKCERVLAMMDDIYAVLVTMDFPDAITGGLRRTTDMVRGVLEKTRGDLTLALQNRELENRLASFLAGTGEAADVLPLMRMPRGGPNSTGNGSTEEGQPG